MSRRHPGRGTASEQLEQRLVLSTITVTSLADEVKIDGAVTLREAVLAANGDISVDGSEAGNGSDKIVFADGLTGSVDLNHSLVVTESVQIVGHGARESWVTGQRSFEAIKVARDAVGVDLTLKDLRVRLADTGVQHWGDGGSLTLIRSQMRNNSTGVGVFNDLQLLSSEIHGNQLRGVAMTGDNLRIRNSRISNNGDSFFTEANVDIVGLLYNANTNRLRFERSSGQVVNSTITNNERGGLLLNDGILTVQYSTIVGNASYGIATGSFDFVRLWNSVVANNIDPDGERTDLQGDVSLLGSNFVSSHRNGSGGEPDFRDNLFGTAAAPLDPMLGPLQDNGGAFHTMMPLPDSPLIDGVVVPSTSSGAPVPPANDYRGVRRQVGRAADRGAVEFTDARLLVTPVTTTSSEGDLVTASVSLLEPAFSPFTVTVSTLDVSTIAGRDYETLNQEITFDGTVGQSFDVVLTTIDDQEFERDEGVELLLTGADGTHVGFPRTSIEIQSDEVSGLGLSGGLLLGRGTAANDVVTVVEEGDVVTANLSGEVLSVNRSLFGTMEIHLGDGTNRLTLPETFSIDTTVIGGSGPDEITTGAGNDFVRGRAGRDLIDTGKGGDTVYGGGGQDTIHGRRGPDRLYGEDGSDFITGQGGFDAIYGGVGADTLVGGDLVDTLVGGAGSDLLKGGDYKDVLYTFAGGLDSNPRGVDGPNRVLGGRGNDSIYGGHSFDRLEGQAGNDYISGYGLLYGGQDSDRLDLRPSATTNDITNGTKNTTLSGGPAHDRIYNYSDLAATLHGGSGTDSLYSLGDAHDLLIGSTGDDRLYGSDGDNTLRGGDGDDRLFGDDGNDSLQGQGGRDSLYGNDGDDTLRGGEHHDLMDGGAGNDSLFGDGGRDVVIGGAGADSLFSDVGEDILIGGIYSPQVSSHVPFFLMEWNSDRDFFSRQANLIDGSGSDPRDNGDAYLLDSGDDQTIFDDDEVDTVRGGAAMDWLFVNTDHDDWLE